MSEDELRDKLTEKITGRVLMDEFTVQVFKPWQVRGIVDALMPVVWEALAQAWGDGYRSCCIEPGWTDQNNPWRRP